MQIVLKIFWDITDLRYLIEQPAVLNLEASCSTYFSHDRVHLWVIQEIYVLHIINMNIFKIYVTINFYIQFAVKST